MNVALNVSIRGMFMYEALLKMAVPKSLGLAYQDKDAEQEEIGINVGEVINFTENLHLLNNLASVFYRINQVMFEEFTREHKKARKISPPLKLLSYDDYLYFIKISKPIVKEIQSTQKQEYALQHMAYDKLQHRALTQRIRDANIVGLKGEGVDNARKRLKELDKAETKMADLDATLIMLNERTPKQLLEFAETYHLIRHTENASGYMQYLKDNKPDAIEQLTKLNIPACIKEDDRKKHTYIVGGSGSGKSELIKLFVDEYTRQSDLAACIVIDPHGDLTTELAKRKAGAKNTAYFAANMEKGHAFRINPLEPPKNSTPEEREVIAQQLVGAFEELLKGGGGSSLTVNMRALILPCLIVLLDAGDKTLIDLQNFLREETQAPYIKLGEASPRPAIARFFKQDFSDKLFSITKQSLRTKLQSLFNTEQFYNTVNGSTTVNLEQLIDDKQTMLFNLSKGDMGADVSEAIGRFIIALVQGIAMRRQKIAKSDRTPLHMFIDECQNYIGTSTVTILEEARKYGVHLTLAQQVAGRGMSPEIRTVTLNNTNIKIMGRTPDDRRMAGILGIDNEEAQQLPTGHFYCKAGSKPAFLFKANARLIFDQDLYMTPQEFEKYLQQQVKRYYAPINTPKNTGARRELV